MIKSRISKEKQKQLVDIKRPKIRKYWTEEEDTILRTTVQVHGSNWRVIAEYLVGRNASQCAQRWKRVKPATETKNQKWSTFEDEEVKRLSLQYKCDWRKIALYIPNRTGRQIRERYINHLDPNISSKVWSQSEDLKIWKLYQRMGSKWSEMAKQLKGRPENTIKNRFYGYIRKYYANQENPYYVIPEQKRTLLQLDGDNDQVAEEHEKETKTGTNNIQQQQNIESQIKNKLIPQQQEFESLHSEFNSLNFQIQSDRHIQFNIGEIKNYESFQKMIFESDNEMKMDHLFSNFLSYESNHISRNPVHCTIARQKEDDNDDNFANQFFSAEGLSIPVKMRTDIFEEITKFQSIEY